MTWLIKQIQSYSNTAFYLSNSFDFNGFKSKFRMYIH